MKTSIVLLAFLCASALAEKYVAEIKAEVKEYVKECWKEYSADKDIDYSSEVTEENAKEVYGVLLSCAQSAYAEYGTETVGTLRACLTKAYMKSGKTYSQSEDYTDEEYDEMLSWFEAELDICIDEWYEENHVVAEEEESSSLLQKPALRVFKN
mmetsp:Transcript_33302/g.58420  ORF Transcript_33302/g.58420 Transcript_33302/m.58420 type:complete len:154 (+) Transcript_33302:517-978(+)